MRYQGNPVSLLSILASFMTGTTAESPYTLAARRTSLRNSSLVPASTSASAVATITGRPPPSNIPLSCYPTELRTTIPRWWGSDVAENTCTTLMDDGCPRWNPCNISVGTIQLMYWSTAVNQSWTLPTTLYNSEYDFTFTYPSVYMIYHAISAYNSCNGNKRAPLGPTLTTAIQDWALTDVSTMIPHTYPQEPGSMTDPRQFNPADLYNCTATSSAYTSSDIYGDPGPYAAGHQCNPFMSLSTRVRWLGEPYWRSCGIDNKASRAYDPPSALKMVTSLVPASNPDPATTPIIPAAVPETTVAQATTPAVDISTLSATEQKDTPVAASSTASSVETPQDANPGNESPSPNSDPAQRTTTTIPFSQTTSAVQIANNDPENSKPLTSTESATPIVEAAISQSNVLSPDPGNPTSPTSVKSLGQGTSSNKNPEIDPDNQNAEPAPSVKIQVTSTAQQITFLGVTLDYSSAPIATVSSLNAVISYGSEGVVIQYPSGIVSTVAVQGPTTPTSASTPSDSSGESSAKDPGMESAEHGTFPLKDGDPSLETEPPSVGGGSQAAESSSAVKEKVSGVAEKSKAAGEASSSSNSLEAGPDATIASVINAIMNGGPTPSTPTTTAAASSLTASGSSAAVGGDDSENIHPTPSGIGSGGTKVITTGTSLLNETSTAAPSVVLTSNAPKVRILISCALVSLGCALIVI